MGQVYLARDTRLERLVALKVLPEAFAADEQRLRRFLQEAKITSALKHPNIGHIYEIGQEAGVYYIAMEYVEGPTLGALIAHKPLPLDQIIDLALQTADAVAEAHDAGVLHRDIKPDNLMLDKRGRLKVLDFGLARMDKRPEAGSAGETRTQAITNPGVIMGTPLYMSPEQALGHATDDRSDLFSFGVVMYQMATGALPFQGRTSPEITDAILHQAVTSPVRLNSRIPPELERIILRLLERDPALRYQSASDLAADLKRLRRDSESGRHAPALARSGPVRAAWWLSASAAALVLSAAAWFFVQSRTRPPATAPEQAEMTVRPFLTSPTNESMPAFSPDGKTVAFSWDGEDGSNRDIYVKLVDAGNPLRLTTDPAVDIYPAWSPDGRFIAFGRIDAKHTQLLTVPALGGPERKLVEISSFGPPSLWLAPSWHPSGKSIAFANSPEGERPGIFRLDLESGQQQRLTTAPAAVLYDSMPAFSPDGKTLAFFRYRSTVSGDIMLLSMENGSLRNLPASSLPSGLAWMPDGRSLLLGGTAGVTGANVGRLSRLPLNTLKPAVIAIGGTGAAYPSPSPEGRRVVYVQTFADSNIWHAALETPARLSQSRMWIGSTRAERDPRYSPDGAHILFLSDRSGRVEFWQADADGKNAQQLTNNTPGFGSPQWSPDGTRVVFDGRVNGNADIFVMNVAGGAAKRLTDDPAEDIVPSFSRDGQWIYFCSNRSGMQQLWRMPASGGSAQQITQDGGFDSQESRDGNYLYYTKGRQKQGLVRRGVDGREEMLLPDLIGRIWVAGEKGVYYIDPNDRERRLQYFDLATRRATVLTRISKMCSATNRCVSLSPDERNLLWVQTDSFNTDLMLIENFR
jgi:eukaryotic-like serine/threonine-protein kinase